MDAELISMYKACYKRSQCKPSVCNLKLLKIVSLEYIAIKLSQHNVHSSAVKKDRTLEHIFFLTQSEQRKIKLYF